MNMQFIAYALFLSLLSFTVFAQDGLNPNGSDSYMESKIEQSGKVEERIQLFKNAKVYRFAMVNGVLAELYVGEVKIPADQYDQYTAMIANIRKYVRESHVKAKTQRARAQRGQVRSKLAHK